MDCQKKELRQIFKAQRAKLEPLQKEKQDAKIAAHVCASAVYQKAQVLLLYASTAQEIDTASILTDALQKGKAVYFPKCVFGTKTMEFYRVFSKKDLTPGAYGILEPKADPKNKLKNLEFGLCIVPALCYDKKGYRLGYGGGYYDRFLNLYHGNTVGLVYQSGYVDALPRNSYDQAVQYIITEQQIFTVDCRMK